jgi:hypothetical protein
MPTTYLLTVTWRIVVSPITGAIDGVRKAYNRPRAANWREFIWNDVRAYFSPLTGAISGVSGAVRRATGRGG